MKDFHDVWAQSSPFAFSCARLSSAAAVCTPQRERLLDFALDFVRSSVAVE